MSEQAPLSGERSMERLSFAAGQPYEVVEAAIHLNRYLLAAPLCAGRRVLDIACGEGYGSFLIGERWNAREVVAVDISAEALASARAQFSSPKIEYHQGDAEHVGALFAPGSFDLIISLETIEHLRDPEVFVHGLSRVLAPGGIIIISCPNDYWYYRTPNESNPFHVRKYTLDDFRTLTESALGTAAGFLLGAPAAGFINFQAERLSGVNGSSVLMLSAREQAVTQVLPTEEAVTPENARYYVGLWGCEPSALTSAVVFPVSMDSSREAHRAMQVSSLREEVIALRTARFDADQRETTAASMQATQQTIIKNLQEEVIALQTARFDADQREKTAASMQATQQTIIKNLQEEVIALQTACHDADQREKTVASMQPAQQTIIKNLQEEVIALQTACHDVDQREKTAAEQVRQLNLRIVEYELQVRHGGLRISAIKAEAEYIREEAGNLRWQLEQLRKEAEQLREEAGDSRRQLEQSRLRLEQLHKEAEQLREEAGDSRRQLEQSRLRLEQLHKEAEQLREEAGDSRLQLEQLRKKDLSNPYSILRRFGGRVLRKLGLRK